MNQIICRRFFVRHNKLQHIFYLNAENKSEIFDAPTEIYIIQAVTSIFVHIIHSYQSENRLN